MELDLNTQFRGNRPFSIHSSHEHYKNVCHGVLSSDSGGSGSWATDNHTDHALCSNIGEIKDDRNSVYFARVNQQLLHVERPTTDFLSCDNARGFVISRNINIQITSLALQYLDIFRILSFRQDVY